MAPAYDLCPQPRSGTEASQAMAIGRDGQRASRVDVCRDACEIFLLTPAEADNIIDGQIAVINDQWDEAAEAAHLTPQDKQRLWQHQILNPSIYT